MNTVPSPLSRRPGSVRAWLRPSLAASFLLVAFPAMAQQIVLDASSVIGGGPTYGGGHFDTGSNPASLAVDEQTGALQNETDSRNNYWLGPDSVTSSYFVLDLGAAYTIGQIDLFNTHNWESLDRSTKDFHIDASNSISSFDTTTGYDLTSAVTILSGTLAFPADNPPEDNVFTSANGLTSGATAYRYLSFTFDSYRGASDTPGWSGGLHEIRVYQSAAVPEPSTYAAIFGALALAGGIVARRRPRNRTAG